MSEKRKSPMSKFDLQGKIAVVTGASRGIGKSIAMGYAEAGAYVVVVSRNQQDLDKVAAELKSVGRDSLAIATDICMPEQVERMVKRTVETFGRIDIFVNNAANVNTINGIEELSNEEWDAGITTNLTGPFYCSRAAAKVMIAQKSGKIINVSSVAGISANPIAHYGAAKAAVINLTMTSAARWAAHNINVNCIVPGLIATEGQKQYGLIPPDRNEDGTPVPPLLMPPGPEAVADLAIFLASAASDHITGEVIPIRSFGAHDGR